MAGRSGWAAVWVAAILGWGFAAGSGLAERFPEAAVGAGAPGDGSEDGEPIRATSVADGMVCPEGGEVYPTDVAFCPKHGVKLTAADGESPWLTDVITGLEFVWVEGGCFPMGDDQGEERERPAHRVCVSSFWMGRFEVTQGQWQRVMGENPSNFKGLERPVENVSWGDANDFLAQLGQQAGRNYRLPTEAEWEFAARGGNKSQGFPYAGADSLDEVGWYAENSGGAEIPVGRRAPNELGLFDMSGNVWEWCADWYDQAYYRWSPQDDPVGPDQGSYRVRRGGSWSSFPERARSTDRGWYDPASRYKNLGFRVALSP